MSATPKRPLLDFIVSASNTVHTATNIEIAQETTKIDSPRIPTMLHYTLQEIKSGQKIAEVKAVARVKSQTDTYDD